MARPTALWVGGTSALARTYFDEVHSTSSLRIIIAAPSLPAWPLPVDVVFVKLDLFSEESVGSLWQRLPHATDVLILGVRLSLVWAGDRQSALATHLRHLIDGSAKNGCRAVLHISSVAVADHVVAQHNVNESMPLPDADAYHSDYDLFKRRSEDMVDAGCTDEVGRGGVMEWTHLRISGIFSNDPACIQCTAVRNQRWVSCYSRTCIDFNSSANVSHALALLAERLASAARRPPKVSCQPSVETRPKRVYFYTRSTAEPVPYGSLVADYRAAHGIWYGVWLPAALYGAFVKFARAICDAIPLGVARSIAYLLAVSVADHTFDNSRFRADFPELGAREESVRDAFARIERRQAEARAQMRAGPQPVGVGEHILQAAARLAILILFVGMALTRLGVLRFVA